MFERTLNAFWIVLGAASAAYAWSLGMVGPAGPESGLFPFIASVIVSGAGIVLLLRPATQARAADFPRSSGLWRVLGVILGLIVMAAGMPYLGFCVTSFITMIILLRTVDRSSWLSAVALAFLSTASVFWLFGYILGMALPRGPWGW
ncbi:MAG TPA: tripartite tricarboxylate transporter TctB family protein [Pseudolabrys sp.]|nr:tripartite tricarboxylate transporter TctB family protein [Pseudolabrys sp.]